MIDIKLLLLHDICRHMILMDISTGVFIRMLQLNMLMTVMKIVAYSCLKIFLPNVMRKEGNYSINEFFLMEIKWLY